MSVLIGVAIAIALFVVVIVGVIMWNRPQEEATEQTPEEVGTSYEEPQDEGAAELNGQDPVQGGGGGAQSG